MNPLATYSAFPLTLTLPSSRRVSLAACFHNFKRWEGQTIQDTYGGKAVLDCDGEPLFAELAILRLIQAQEWQGVWIDTYRKRFRQFLPPHSYDLPSHAQAFLDKASGGKKWPPGRFDVLAWNDGRYLFVEAKRKGKDAIRQTQLEWLESALNAGLPVESFIIFEWKILDEKIAAKLA